MLVKILLFLVVLQTCLAIPAYLLRCEPPDISERELALARTGRRNALHAEALQARAKAKANHGATASSISSPPAAMTAAANATNVTLAANATAAVLASNATANVLAAAATVTVTVTDTVTVDAAGMTLAANGTANVLAATDLGNGTATATDTAAVATATGTKVKGKDKEKGRIGGAQGKANVFLT